MDEFPTFKSSWPWPLSWIGSHCIPSCITRRPVSTYQISLKSKKLFADGWMYRRTDGHLRQTLLGRLEGVDLIIWPVLTSSTHLPWSNNSAINHCPSLGTRKAMVWMMSTWRCNDVKGKHTNKKDKPVHWASWPWSSDELGSSISDFLAVFFDFFRSLEHHFHSGCCLKWASFTYTASVTETEEYFILKVGNTFT